MKNVSRLFYTKICVIFSLLLLLICIFQGILYGIKPNTNLIEDSVDMSKGWYDKDHNSISLSPFLSNKSIKYGKTNTIYYDITKEIKPGYSICFRSLSTHFKAYIDDKVILQSNYIDSPLFNDSTGSQWHFYTVKEEDIGKTIKVKFTLFYNDSASYFENMRACSQKDYIINAFINKLYELCVMLFIFAVGVFITIIGIYIKVKLHINRDILISLGVFAINIAVWCTFETHLIELLFNASSIVHIVCCNTLLLLPLTCVQFVSHLFDIKYQKYFNFSALVSSISYVLCWILNITGIKDFHHSLFLCYISIVVLGLVCILVVFLDNKHLFIRKKSGKTEVKKPSFFKVVASWIFLFCLLVDIIIYSIAAQNITSQFYRTSLIYAIVMCLIVAVHNIVNLSDEFNHATAMEKVAYNDILTGFFNRTAYEDKLISLNSNLDAHDCIGIIYFDINDLKYVNDNLGHNYGDELIISASQIIQNSFAVSSDLYRIGGDEFVAIITAPNAKQVYKESLIQFKANIQNFNNFYNKPYRLSIAEGSAFYTKGSSQTISTITEYADQAMYKNKLEYKKNHTSI